VVGLKHGRSDSNIETRIEELVGVCGSNCFTSSVIGVSWGSFNRDFVFTGQDIISCVVFLIGIERDSTIGIDSDITTSETCRAAVNGSYRGASVLNWAEVRINGEFVDREVDVRAGKLIRRSGALVDCCNSELRGTRVVEGNGRRGRCRAHTSVR